jgi:hypothetical protein
VPGSQAANVSVLSVAHAARRARTRSFAVIQAPRLPTLGQNGLGRFRFSRPGEWVAQEAALPVLRPLGVAALLHRLPYRTETVAPFAAIVRKTMCWHAERASCAAPIAA